MTARRVGDGWGLVHDRMVLARWHVGLAGVLAVLAASLCLQPLLDGGWWLPRTLVVVGVVALTGLVVRAAKLPAPLHPLIQAGTLLLSLVWLFAREQAHWGLVPGRASIDRLRELVVQAVDYAEVSVPPAGYDLGLLMVIVAGVGLVALVVDTLAAALDLPGLTLLPLGTLFVVPWAVNLGWAPAWTFVAVAAGWLGVLAAGQRDRAALWSPDARPGSSGIGIAVAAVTTVVALLAGGLATLRGPVEPLLLGSGSGSGGTVEVDALVSLRRSLVSNDDRVMLTYTTTADPPEYLRLAVLEEFDGEQWRPGASTVLGPLPPPGPSGAASGSGTGPLAEYRIDVGPLTGTTLPSPTGALTILNDWPVTWDQRSSLPIRADGSTIEGTQISLVVAPPTWDETSLRAASRTSTDGAGVYPEDLADPTPLVGEELPTLAREVTAGTRTPYDAAVALQRWFTTDGGFTYSTEIDGGSDGDALATFLDERVGYCEQFAATMALMARSVGIPARVVVGLTQGREDGDKWVARASDAHAWPELWMGAAGWVRFEPTPGAPSTTTPEYTVPEQATAAPSQAPTSTASAGPTDSSEVPAQVPDDETAAQGADTGRSQGLPVGWMLVGLLLLVLAVPALVRLSRHRRRLRIGDAESAYREVTDTLVDLRLGTESATPRATVTAVGAALRVTGGDAAADEALGRILRAVEWQRYGARRGEDGGPAGSRGGGAGAPTPVGPGARAGVALAEPAPPRATSRPGALSADIRIVRRALGRRAGRVGRVRAALIPRSVLAGLAAWARSPGMDREPGVDRGAGVDSGPGGAG